MEIQQSSLDPHENVNVHQHIQDLLKQQQVYETHDLPQKEKYLSK
jgi:hypothetical protein